jgi:hypothetical protein
VTLRLCGFDVETGLGAFLTLPMAKHVSGEGRLGAASGLATCSGAAARRRLRQR